jgi:hypothetical protein
MARFVYIKRYGKQILVCKCECQECAAAVVELEAARKAFRGAANRLRRHNRKKQKQSDTPEALRRRVRARLRELMPTGV